MWEWRWKLWWEGEYFWCGPPCLEHGKDRLVGSLGDIRFNEGREFFFHFRVARVDVREGAGLPSRARTFCVEGEAEWDLLAVLFLGWCARPVRVEGAVLLIRDFPLVVEARVRRWVRWWCGCPRLLRLGLFLCFWSCRLLLLLRLALAHCLWFSLNLDDAGREADGTQLAGHDVIVN